MKTKLPHIFCLLALLTLGLGCKKFLDINVNSNQQLNPHTVQDYEEMLNAPGLYSPDYFLADVMSDDYNFYGLSSPIMSLYGKLPAKNLYLFESRIWPDDVDDLMYNNGYKWIMQMNLVISNMGSATAGTAQRKAIAIARAKINRAYYYLQLCNLYGPAYQAATANTALAVPIVLDMKFATPVKRATVQQVYQLVLADLNDALHTAALPNDRQGVFGPGKVSASALLARTYLLMGNYAEALAAATAALAVRNTLFNYNNDNYKIDKRFGRIDGKLYVDFLSQGDHPENLLVRFVDNPLTSFTFIEIGTSAELMRLLGPVDLRTISNMYYLDATSTIEAGYVMYKKPVSASNPFFFNYSLGVPEMMLIRAECLARNGDAAGAINLLNTLRQNRFKPTDYVPLNTGVDAATALKQVLDERRRELFFKGGVRLFDLKRLNLDPAFKKDIVRTKTFDSDVVVATLPPGSPRYLVPFSAALLAISPAIVQNER